MFKTLAYADIFDYPLTAEEIQRWLIKGDNGNRGSHWGDYYFLPGRKAVVALRQRRERASRIKLKKLKQLVVIFQLIPWIKLVCVTGALAMSNSDAADDMDLMIITTKNRLWLTRLLVSLLLFPRLRRGQKINNRICINLWLDETALAIKQRDLYIAHEICQAKPVLNRDKTYERFISANLWFKQFLPNWTS